MTIWTIFGALRRNVVIVLLGCLMTGLALVGITRIPGVYSSSVAVVFLLPKTDQNPNSLQFTSESLIHFAGLVARAVSHGTTQSKTTSNAVTLANSGIVDGYSVRLPDAGGQWAHNYNRPELAVQVTGPSPEVVSQRMETVLSEIDQTVARLQKEKDVSEDRIVRTRPDPAVPPMFFNAGSKTRALVITMALGGFATVGAAMLVDSLRSSRRRRKAVPTSESVEVAA